MSKKSWPILYSKLLHSQDFLDVYYTVSTQHNTSNDWQRSQRKMFFFSPIITMKKIWKMYVKNMKAKLIRYIEFIIGVEISCATN